MCFPIMAINFFRAFLWYRSPCRDHQLYFLLVNWKVYLNLGFGLFCSTGSSVSYASWHNQGAQAVPVASPACWLCSNAMRALCLLLMLLQHSSISPYVGEGSISAKNKFFSSENASLRAPCRAGCAMWARLLFLSSPCTTIQAPWLGCQTAMLHQPATLTSPLPSEKLLRAGSRGLQQADEQFW